MTKAVSLSPDDFTEGGGLVDDVDVVFKECRFDLFDYNGKIAQGVPSLKLSLELEDGEEAEQYYSMGSANDWMPSEDGKQLIAVGKAEHIRVTSNGGIFLKSLIDAGFPPEKLDDDISVLDKMEAHMVRVPAPKRPGLKRNKREDGRDFEETILIVSEIKTLPWESKGKAKGKAPAKGKTQSKSKAKDTGSDVDSVATETILAILADEGSITKKELPAKIFQVLKDNPDRNAVVKAAFDDDFLSNGPWTYEDGTLIA